MKYKKLTQREHILLRPETYIGTVNPTEENRYVVEDPSNVLSTKIVKKQVKFTPAFLKIFDEPIVNAMDHFTRSGKVKSIEVVVNPEGGFIEIKNDGPGIPIEMDTKEKIWIPEMVFFHFLSGSNFDDSDQRFTGGRNGIGIKSTVTFSKKFTLETADGKKKYVQNSTDNLSNLEKPTITKSKETFTKIKFYPDFERFGMSSLDQDTMSLMAKRIFDAATYCGKGVKIIYNGSQVPVKSLVDYAKMHLEEGSEIYSEKLKNGWEFCISKSPSEQFQSVSIVNGINTYDGGTHVNWISQTVAKLMAEGFKKSKVTWVDVKNHLFMFMVCRIPNPTFTSQTKEQLTNYISKEIIGDSSISPKMIKDLSNSEISKSILEALEIREKIELKKLQISKRTKVEKLTDANSRNRAKCELYIFEGDSAGQPMRDFRDPQTQGYFCLRGKFINVSEIEGRKVVENKEAFNLMQAIGLVWGQEVRRDQLRFSKIVIATDADVDGDSITGLLLNFFSNWPNLFEMGIIHRCMTPLMIAKDKKSKSEKYFYNYPEYESFSKSHEMSKYLISYKKGIGSLDRHQFRNIISSPILVKYSIDKQSVDYLNIWFGSDSGPRKVELAQ